MSCYFPKEMYELIFSFSSIDDLYQISLCCRKFRDITKYERDRYIAKKLWGKFTYEVCNYFKCKGFNPYGSMIYKSITQTLPDKLKKLIREHFKKDVPPKRIGIIFQSYHDWETFKHVYTKEQRIEIEKNKETNSYFKCLGNDKLMLISNKINPTDEKEINKIFRQYLKKSNYLY